MADEVKLKGRIYFVPYEDDGVTVKDDPTDITEAVQAMYDNFVSSQEFGSNYFSAEDTEPVVQIAKLMGFTKWQEAEHYVNESKHSKEQQEFLAKRTRQVGHDHIFVAFDAATGTYSPETEQCQWPNCFMKKDSLVYKQWELEKQMERGEIPHDHIFSSIGVCMWPRCQVIEARLDDGV